MRMEIQEKLARVRQYLEDQAYDGVLFTTNDYFCWMSGGKYAYVDKGTGVAASKLLITMDHQYVICNSSEQYRVTQEELPQQEFELISFLWHESEEEVLKPYLEQKNIVSDSGAFGTLNRGAELQKLRYTLTREELERYRMIGPESAGLLEESCRRIQKGETELEIAGRTTGMLMAAGYQVPVCLVAADERLKKYRHPIPTLHRVGQYAMVAVCAQKYGLTVSMSRIISFGAPDADKEKRMDAVAKIDAAYICGTEPGVPVKDVLQAGYDAYQRLGYEEDFHLHHQGGPLGYPTRDFCTTFRNQEVVLERQAFSWNPTIAGVKSEDTFLVTEDGQEIISHTGDWVYREVTCGGRTILRPDILVR